MYNIKSLKTLKYYKNIALHMTFGCTACNSMQHLAIKL